MRVAVLGLAGMLLLAHAAGTCRLLLPRCTLLGRHRAPGRLFATERGLPTARLHAAASGQKRVAIFMSRQLGARLVGRACRVHTQLLASSGLVWERASRSLSCFCYQGLGCARVCMYVQWRAPRACARASARIDPWGGEEHACEPVRSDSRACMCVRMRACVCGRACECGCTCAILKRTTRSSAHSCPASQVQTHSLCAFFANSVCCFLLALTQHSPALLRRFGRCVRDCVRRY